MTAKIYQVFGNKQFGKIKGETAPQIPPLQPPMGSGSSPKTPRNNIYHKWDDIKNAIIF